MTELHPWHDYPMGPTLRSYLQISDHMYIGDLKPAATKEQQERFSIFLKSEFANRTPHNDDEFLDVLQELVLMQLGEAALAFAEKFGTPKTTFNFRGQLAIGSAAMLCGNFTMAKATLEKAKRLAPGELATYNNLAQIYYYEKDYKKCSALCFDGLEVEKNAYMLWEHLAYCLHQENQEGAPDKLLSLAKEMDSWAGCSLAAQYCAPRDPHFRVEILEDLQGKAARTDLDLLVELSAACGSAGQFEKIPGLLQKAEEVSQQTGEKIPWQLVAHTAQAYLGMENLSSAGSLLRRALAEEGVPQAARTELQALLQEASNP